MENFPKSHKSRIHRESQSRGTQRGPLEDIIKMAKVQDKERILKAAREKQKVTYKGAPIRLAADFSMEMLQARREWQEIFEVMKTRGLQQRLLYPARLSIKMEGKIRSFPGQKKPQRIYLLQTSSAADAKGFALRTGRKTVREREREEHRYEKNGNE